MTKFKIGDKVKVRTDLCSGTFYGGAIFYSGMCCMKGKTVTIESYSYSGNYTIKELGWFWSDEMFEDNVVFTKDMLETGMIAVTRDKKHIYLVIKNENGLRVPGRDKTAKMLFIAVDAWDNPEFYNKDLTCNSERLIIDEVYRPQLWDLGNITLKDLKEEDLVWRREKEQITEVTLEEIADKFGIPVNKLRIKDKTI